MPILSKAEKDAYRNQMLEKENYELIAELKHLVKIIAYASDSSLSLGVTLVDKMRAEEKSVIVEEVLLQNVEEEVKEMC